MRKVRELRENGYVEGMKKGLIIAFVLGLICSCQPQEKQKREPLSIVSRTTVESDTSLRYRAHIHFPEIDSAAADWQQALNTHFVDNFQQDADSFRRFIQDFDPVFLRELEGSFQVHSNQPCLLSVSQRFVWAVPGTSILLGEVKTTNYLRADQRMLSLADCFKQTDFKEELLRQVQAAVNRQYGKGICRELTTKDLNAFILEAAGMRFFLDIYGGNHACQQVEIILPFERLKGKLRSFVTESVASC